ncbi:MAG: transcriptional regulator [Thermoplasmata archaeon]|nr:transcriptional regulator [Thermoplasmata archaeon]
MEITREAMIRQVRAILKKNGFRLSSELSTSSSYDIIGSRGTEILIIKILYNVDTLKPEIAAELKLLSNILKAKALIIGVRCGIGSLEDSILYSRYGIPVFSVRTFSDFINYDQYPIGFAAPGGFYVKINSKMLKETREKKGISLGELAKVANVSRRSIQLYEEGETAVSIDVIMKIEDFLNVDLIDTVDPFQNLPDMDEIEKFSLPKDSFDKEIEDIFRKMGTFVYFTRKSNVDGLSSIDDIMFLGFSKMEETLMEKVRIIEDIAFITEKSGLVFTEIKDVNRNLPIINIKEIEKDDKDYLKNLILERRYRYH